jgi:hypothetical protein
MGGMKKILSRPLPGIVVMAFLSLVLYMAATALLPPFFNTIIGLVIAVSTFMLLMGISFWAVYRKANKAILIVPILNIVLVAYLAFFGTLVYHRLAVNTIAKDGVKKCKERGYPGDGAIIGRNSGIYACHTRPGVADNWEGAVYYPHETWSGNDKLPNNLTREGIYYCSEVDKDWLWCSET